MSKEIRKAEELEVGKYYKLGYYHFIRVEYMLKDEKCGTSIKIFDWKVAVELENVFCDVADYDSDEHFYSEITQEEFEQKLQEAQEEFVKMINQVKNNDNEETTA